MRRQTAIRLLLADVDGTLVTQEKVLTPAAIAAVQGLRLAGVAFAITSGRPPRGMSMLIPRLALSTPIAAFNGGVFFNADLSVIESRLLDAATSGKAVELITAQGLDVWIYTSDAWLIRDEDAPHVAHEVSTVGFQPEVVTSFTDVHLLHVAKIVGVSNDHALVEACEKALQGSLGGNASVARSQPYYLDVTHPQANKGEVVTTLSKRLDIPLAEIATVGDMPNDVLMFAKSGLSIAMGNASDEVKARASVVTDSNEREGFAKAVKRFILK